MADISLGEPLSFRHAVALWSAETVYGTAVTPATSLGICTTELQVDNGNNALYGPGSRDFLAIVAGETNATFDISIPGVQSGQKTFLAKAFPSSGVLPSFTLGLGYSDDDSPVNRSAYQMAGCRINTLEMGLDASGGNGPLTASVSGEGRVPTTVTTLAPATLTTVPFATYMAVSTLNSVAQDLRSWTMTVNNNLRRDFVIPGTAPVSNLRGPKYLSDGNRNITGTVTFYTRPPVDPIADCPSGVPFLLVLTNPCDSSSTITVTFTDVTFGTVTQSQDENGIVWSTDYQARTVTLT